MAENTAAGTAIGDPVAATDVDGDALTYTLGGDDADVLRHRRGDGPVDDQRRARLRDEDELHGYGLRLLGQGRRGGRHDDGDDHVTDEGLDNAYDLNEDGAIERDEVIAAIQDYLAGNTARSEVTALIGLYFEDGG